MSSAEILLDAGTDIDAVDFSGNTALMGVCFKGYLPIAELLMYRGAKLNLQHGNGGTAFMVAAMFRRNDLLKLLLEKGADPSLADIRRQRAAELAALQGIEEGLAILQH